MTNDEAYRLFEESGALLTGHFKLSSGLHSDRYLEKFRLVENPALLEPMCAEVARRFADKGAQFVLGPTTAGIILAYNVARLLGVGARYAEKVEGVRTLRRGQSLPAGACVIVVDDILTTGRAVRECTDLVAELGAVLVGVAVLGDRSGGTVSFGAPFEAVLTLTVEAYSPDQCPLCASRAPITQPGTQGLRIG